MFELLQKNANRCMSLVVTEIAVIGFFHVLEWNQFLTSEMISLSLHLVLSLFWLCFYVIMRSKLNIWRTKRYSWKRIVGEPLLYMIFDFLVIHIILALAMNQFEFHLPELSIIIILVYGVNLYFDTHQHHCCHDHCD